MHPELSITQIALVILVAIMFGLGFAKIKQPPILGYIIAGLILGPSGFEFIQNRESVEILAEMGVLLLLFVIGIELNLRTFKNVWVITTIATIFQILSCTAVTWLCSYYLGWSNGLALLMGFTVAISSTAVAVNMLESINELQTKAGQISIGILIAQDFAIIPMILILRNFNSNLSIGALFGKMFVAISIIAALIYYLSQKKRVRIEILSQVADRKELLPLLSLGFCFASAALSGLIDLSAAYGAFLAGMIIGNTHERTSVLDAVKPIQSTLMMVFFFSVGILVDLKFIYEHLGMFVILLLIITVVKTTINITALKIMRIPWSETFLIGVVLAQIGEFGFLLANVGYESGIINDFGEKLILSITALSLMFSPVWLTSANFIKNINDKLLLSKTKQAIHFSFSKLIKLFIKKTAKELKHEQDVISNIRDKDKD